MITVGGGWCGGESDRCPWRRHLSGLLPRSIGSPYTARSNDQRRLLGSTYIILSESADRRLNSPSVDEMIRTHTELFVESTFVDAFGGHCDFGGGGGGCGARS